MASTNTIKEIRFFKSVALEVIKHVIYQKLLIIPVWRSTIQMVVIIVEHSSTCDIQISYGTNSSILTFIFFYNK